MFGPPVTDATFSFMIRPLPQELPLIPVDSGNGSKVQTDAGLSLMHAAVWTLTRHFVQDAQHIMLVSIFFQEIRSLLCRHIRFSPSLQGMHHMWLVCLKVHVIAISIIRTVQVYYSAV